jgi:large subunit ribosomal protein L28
MARVCELTSTAVLSGNKVSHSNRKTRRRFLPNLQVVHLFSEKLGRSFSFRITTAALRSVTKNGGLDAFLLKTPCNKLTGKACEIAKQLKCMEANS